MAISKPATRPANPRFSSGPCAKPPTWKLSALDDAPLGRSHRAAVGKAKLAEAIDLTRKVLGIPADYRIGIVPASDTGAFEMAMWSLLGERPAQMVAWESFGAGWVTDVVKQLKIEATTHTAEYGEIVDMAALNYDNDVCFTVTQHRLHSRKTFLGKSWMSRHSLGKRLWAAKRRTVCWCFHHARSNALNHIHLPGPCSR